MVKLLESSDKLRYVVYALKISSSLSADVATLGLGGDEVVKLMFTAVDSLALSNWMVSFRQHLPEQRETVI